MTKTTDDETCGYLSLVYHLCGAWLLNVQKMSLLAFSHGHRSATQILQLFLREQHTTCSCILCAVNAFVAMLIHMQAGKCKNLELLHLGNNYVVACEKHEAHFSGHVSVQECLTFVEVASESLESSSEWKHSTA